MQGARPLFFLDYVASRPPRCLRQVVEVVTGIAEACRAVGCALLGGETAEMPGVYATGAVDVAGTIVGVVDRDAALLPARRPWRRATMLWGLASQRPAHQRLHPDSPAGRGADLRTFADGTPWPMRSLPRTAAT